MCYSCWKVRFSGKFWRADLWGRVGRRFLTLWLAHRSFRPPTRPHRSASQIGLPLSANQRVRNWPHNSASQIGFPSTRPPTFLSCDLSGPLGGRSVRPCESEIRGADRTLQCQSNAVSLEISQTGERIPPSPGVQLAQIGLTDRPPNLTDHMTFWWEAVLRLQRPDRSASQIGLKWPHT